MAESTRGVPDARPAWLRGVVWAGVAVLLMAGSSLTVVGLVEADSSGGRAMACAGVALLVLAGGTIAREVSEARLARSGGPAPRLGQLESEPALHLPRASGPTLASSWSLALLGVVTLFGAVLAAVEGAWVGAVLLAVTALVLVRVSGVPGQASAGGLWATPTRLVDRDRGRITEVAWDDVTGVVPTSPMPVLVRPGADVARSGAWGRTWGSRRGRDGAFRVDTRHLAGGPALAPYVVGKAVVDRDFRAALGSEASLPPRGQA